ncbi:MAG: C_GCAxxG_C_C family protein [Chloroflexi bacterium]|nr:C_GCAxxG_C_C family protein [Chloroflexota bacterium]
MWESFELGSEDLLWAGIAFNGGIAGQQAAPCGVISSSAVSLGLGYRCDRGDKDKSKQARTDIRADAAEMVKGFRETFGAISCRDLLGIDTSDPVLAKQFRESEMHKEKCDKYMEYAVGKLYELYAKRGLGVPAEACGD